MLNTTTRKFPRSLREAFPHLTGETAIGISGPVVIPLRPPWWARVARRMLRMETINGKWRQAP